MEMGTSPLERVLKAASKFRNKRNRRSWQTTHRIADKALPKFVNTLLFEVRNTRNKINVAALGRAVASGNVSEMEKILLLPDIDANLKRKYRKQMHDTLNEAGVASVKLQPKVLASSFGRFDLVNPRAVKWAQEKSATLVAADITPTIQATIRTVIASGIRDGVPVRETARRLRASLGLTPNQWNSVANFQNKLLAKGVTPKLAQERAETFSRKVLRRRAMLIARTETIDAGLQGRTELWDQAADRGLIDKDKVKREWIVTPDDLLDELICAPMPDMPENQNVGLNDMFTTGLGDLVHKPTAHPGCRCDVILKIPGPSLFP